MGPSHLWMLIDHERRLKEGMDDAGSRATSEPVKEKKRVEKNRGILATCEGNKKTAENGKETTFAVFVEVGAWLKEKQKTASFWGRITKDGSGETF